MQEALELLRREHRDLESLLRALEWQVAEFENGNQPDYDVIGAVIEYFLSFPDIYHHPKEELIFAKLRDRDARTARRIGSLRSEHQHLAARAQEFADGLRAVLDEAELPRAAFVRWARGFIDVQRQHIAIEESSFFPAAETALTTSDWADLKALMTPQDGLLSGEGVRERFEQLRKTILGWQAQDQAHKTKQ
jgi:hemerythrin-like domain-containing protein